MPLKERIIHVLAIAPMTKLDLRNRFFPTASEKDKKNLHTVLAQVARLSSGTKYALRREYWRDVNPDHAMFSEGDDREKVKAQAARVLKEGTAERARFTGEPVVVAQRPASAHQLKPSSLDLPTAKNGGGGRGRNSNSTSSVGSAATKASSKDGSEKRKKRMREGDDAAAAVSRPHKVRKADAAAGGAALVAHTQDECVAIFKRFNTSYERYLELHEKLTANRNDFKKLKLELDGVQRDTPEYDTVRKKIQALYAERNDEVTRMDKEFNRLHHQLQDMKAAVKAYEDKHGVCVDV